MAKIKDIIEKDIRELIKGTTGFDEEDENFQLCVAFAESNIKYHRYLSPDSHKLHRTIDGICEKFEVHSQKQKAADFKELAYLFLEQTGLDGKDTGKTDVHYAILSLLLSLAESPTKQDFQRKQKNHVPEEIDTFDWRSYLLDGEDLNFISYATSDSEEESLPHSTDDEEDSSLGQKDGKRNALSNLFSEGSENVIANSSSKTRNSRLEGPSKVTAAGLLSLPSQYEVSQTDEYKQLARTLVVEYWKGRGREEETCGSHAASNLARDWNYYQHQINEFYTPRAQCLVTELQIIRETLWMLSGITELFIFKYNGKEFTLNSDIYVMHLTHESLESLLYPLMRKAGQVCVLQSFVHDIVSQVCSCTTSDSGMNVPQTYQAFASSVSQFLTDFKLQLRDMEKIIMNQEVLMSLEKLASDLQPWLSKVQAVHGVYINGITSVTSLGVDSSTTINNCFKASLLLNVLYQAVFEADLMSVADSGEKTSLLMEMLIKSSGPLIQITSSWINNGQLHDPAGEFIVQRNKGITTLNETFWDQAFLPSVKLSAQEASLLEVSTSQSSGQEISNKAAGMSFSSDPSSHRKISQEPPPDLPVKLGPRFLQPILGDAILTGKSMEMLENLGRMAEVLDVGCVIYECPPTLFELFLKDLKAKQAARLNSHGGNKTPKTDVSVNYKVREFPKDATICQNLNMRGEKDTLLGINCAALFPEPLSCSQEEHSHRDDYEEITKEVTCDLSPLLRLCESCLYPHVRSRYHIVCARLVHILKSEYHLMDCIHAMQRYYLMSSGEVMYDFYTPIFKKIQKREHWQNSSFLELYLHEAVAPQYPGDLSRLSVTVSSAAKCKEKSPIGLTDCIQLKYKVPWPVDVVISGKCQDLYNDVFTFLLQVKRVKYFVDQLRFEELSRYQAVPKDSFLNKREEERIEDSGNMSREEKVHRCQLLRFRLLYFVNSLHNYIMTRILHSTGLEFASQLEGATDLEQIISIHREYVEAIHERCLLHPKLSFLREAVVNVLNLSLTFSMLWQQGIDLMSGSSVEAMELDLSRCVHFLSAFLNNVVKRGSFPHLESLAFSLLTPTQQVNKPLL